MTGPERDRRDAQRRVAEAAAAAATIYAASRSDDDLIAAIGRITNSAAALTSTAVLTATASIIALWRATNPYDDVAVAKFAAESGKIIVSAQRATATIHAAAQLSQLRTMGIVANVAVTIPDQVRGATVEFGRQVSITAPATTTVTYQTTDDPEHDGDETDETEAPRADAQDVSDTGTVTREVRYADSAPDKLFERAAATYRYERSTGTDHAGANDAAEQRIEGLIETNVMLAQRLAEQQTLARVVDLDERIIGYRRVIHPELSKGGTCGLCIAASDRIYKIAELKPLHDDCKCTVAAVTATHDPGFRINEDDLAQLYADASGTTSGRTKGHNLKRTRYVIETHHELGAVLKRVSADSGKKRKSAPRKTNRQTAAPDVGRTHETAADKARRLLPGFESSVAAAIERGMDEDSQQVQWLRGQIKKLQAALR